MKIDITKKIKKKLLRHRQKKIYYLRAVIHITKYFIFKDFRKNRCLIDPADDFFYKYRRLNFFFNFILFLISIYLKKKKIFISINNNCNSNIGHIYGEIDQLKRMQLLDKKYSSSKIIFTTSKKEILNETKKIFESKKFSILFGGLKRLILTFVAIRYPSISIDASMGVHNCIKGFDDSPRKVYHAKSKYRANLILKSNNFYPNKKKISLFNTDADKLKNSLNILTKYIVVQIKIEKVNATLQILNPKALLDSIKYFKKKNYQIVFAGREKMPEIFKNLDVIDYANSKFASVLNDYLLVRGCSLVIASASGFCMIPETLDKPLLTINSFHGVQYFGRRVILLPSLLARTNKIFNSRIQHNYLCTYGVDCGFKVFSDMYVYHMPTNLEILQASKELEDMITDQIPNLTPLQQKIKKIGTCPLLSSGLSRISNYYLERHQNFYEI